MAPKECLHEYGQRLDSMLQFSSVQLLSCVQLFATP